MILMNIKNLIGDMARHRHRQKDNIRIYLKEIDVNINNWIDPTQDWDYQISFGTQEINVNINNWIDSTQDWGYQISLGGLP